MNLAAFSFITLFAHEILLCNMAEQYAYSKQDFSPLILAMITLRFSDQKNGKPW